MCRHGSLAGKGLRNDPGYGADSGTGSVAGQLGAEWIAKTIPEGADLLTFISL
jgi:hypothetical protein